MSTLHNPNGFGLAETLVAGAIGAIILAGIATSIQFTNRAANGLQQGSDMSSLKTLATQVLSQPGSCKASLPASARLDKTATPISITQIVPTILVDGKPVATAPILDLTRSTRYDSFNINRIELRPNPDQVSALFSGTSATSASIQSDLYIEASRGLASMGGPTMSKSIPVTMNVSYSSGKASILDCSLGDGTGASGSSPTCRKYEVAEGDSCVDKSVDTTPIDLSRPGSPDAEKLLAAAGCHWLKWSGAFRGGWLGCSKGYYTAGITTYGRATSSLCCPFPSNVAEDSVDTSALYGTAFGGDAQKALEESGHCSVQSYSDGFASTPPNVWRSCPQGNYIAGVLTGLEAQICCSLPHYFEVVSSSAPTQIIDSQPKGALRQKWLESKFGCIYASRDAYGSSRDSRTGVTDSPWMACPKSYFLSSLTDEYDALCCPFP